MPKSERDARLVGYHLSAAIDLVPLTFFAVRAIRWGRAEDFDLMIFWALALASTPAHWVLVALLAATFDPDDRGWAFHSLFAILGGLVLFAMATERMAELPL